MTKPAIFFDRDGTLLYEVGYLSRREDACWLTGSLDAIRLVNRAGFLAFVITNQGGVGLGMFPESFVIDLHKELDSQVRASGGRIDGWFYCPHHPRARTPELAVDCECRKPRSGMIRQAQAQFPIDLGRSFVVGDKRVDMDLAAGIGATGVFVETGHGHAELSREGGTMPGAAIVAPDIMAATSWMLRRAGQPQLEATR